MIACNWRGNVKRSTSHHARYKTIQRPHFPRYLDKYNLSRGKYRGSSTEASGKYGFRAAPTRMPPLYRSCKNCLFSVLWQIRQRQIQIQQMRNIVKSPLFSPLADACHMQIINSHLSSPPVLRRKDSKLDCVHTVSLTVHMIGVCRIKLDLWVDEIWVSVSGICSSLCPASKLDDGVVEGQARDDGGWCSNGPAKGGAWAAEKVR